MSSVSPSYIELLPDKIFLEIFSYFFHHELCQTWTGLNFRIDHILRSNRCCLYLWTNNCLKEHADCLRNWGETIISLKDSREDNNGIEYIDIDPIDLRLLVNLRRLSQKHCIWEEFEQISPKDLPYLERLHISDYKRAFSDDKRILFGHDQFPFLTSVSDVYVSDKHEDDTTTNTIIRHIGISSDFWPVSFASFIKLIKRLPNLITLQAKIHEFKNIHPPSHITTKIRNISMWLTSQTTLDEIEFLLQISDITQLYLEIGSQGRYGCSRKPFDFVRLAQILNSCQTLKHVKLQIWEIADNINIEEIRQLSPWFASLHFGPHHRKSLETRDHRLEFVHLRF